LLSIACGQESGVRDLAGDLERMRTALERPSDGLAFLAGRIDLERLGMAGHSAGGGAIADRGGRASVLIPLAAGGTRAIACHLLPAA